MLLRLASQLLLQQLDLTMGWMCSQILLCFRGADRVLALRGMGLCTSVALAVKSTLARRGRVLFVLDEEYCFRDCVLVLSREGELENWIRVLALRGYWFRVNWEILFP